MRIAACALVLLASAAQATGEPAEPVPAKRGTRAPVDEVLAVVERNYRAPKHLSATFTQTLTRAIGGKPAESLGTLRVEKPGKIHVQYLQPKRKDARPKMTYLLDGRSLHVIDHGNLQYAQRAAAASQLPALVAFFLGEGTLSRDFEVTLTSDKAFVPAGVTALELRPRTANAAYARVILVLDKQARVERSIVINSSGDLQEMRFAGVELDKPAPAGTFVFDRRQVAGFKRIP